MIDLQYPVKLYGFEIYVTIAIVLVGCLIISCILSTSSFVTVTYQ